MQSYSVCNFWGVSFLHGVYTIHVMYCAVDTAFLCTDKQLINLCKICVSFICGVYLLYDVSIFYSVSIQRFIQRFYTDKQLIIIILCIFSCTLYISFVGATFSVHNTMYIVIVVFWPSLYCKFLATLQCLAHIFILTLHLDRG